MVSLKIVADKKLSNGILQGVTCHTFIFLQCTDSSTKSPSHCDHGVKMDRGRASLKGFFIFV